MKTETQETRTHIARMEKSIDTLSEALVKIAEGQQMKGTWSHLETVVKYQEIARAALVKYALEA